VVTAEQVAAFERDGYVHIPGVLTEAEMAQVEEPMGKFLRGEVLPKGKDLCDMSVGLLHHSRGCQSLAHG
jgi:phytanoyl-CoA hydroxylase